MSFETIEENRSHWAQEMVLLEILIGLRVHANKTIFSCWCFLSSVRLIVQKKRNGSGWFSEKLGSGTRRRRNAWGRGCPVTRVRPRGRHFVGPVGLVWTCVDLWDLGDTSDIRRLRLSVGKRQPLLLFWRRKEKKTAIWRSLPTRYCLCTAVAVVE